MRRKDMQPGVLYAIRTNGMMRPGWVFDSTHAESIRVRVYWTWPPPNFVDDGSTDYRDTDYLDPTPDLLSPLAKYDDKRVKTSDVFQEWEPWATEAKAERAERLQARLDQEQQERDDLAAEHASNRQRLANVDFLLQDATGYLSMDHLASDLIHARTQTRYSAQDVLELLEAIATKTMGLSQ